MLDEVEEAGSGISIKTDVGVLVFADDFVLTINAEDLQMLIDVAQEFYNKWKLKFTSKRVLLWYI